MKTIALILKLWNSSAAPQVADVDAPAMEVQLSAADSAKVENLRASLASDDDGGPIDLSKPMDVYGWTTAVGGVPKSK
jgi:hypothetical protein